VLHHVVHHRIGKATVAASIGQWKREDVERDMSDAEQEAIVTAFQQNIESLQIKRERKEKKSRKRVAAPVEDAPAAQQADAALPSAVTPMVSHASVPAFLPFFLDGFGLYLSQHPQALCPVDLPLELAPPQRRSSAVRQLQPEAANSSVAAAPSFDAQHSGLDAVVQAASASELAHEGGDAAVPPAADSPSASALMPRRVRHKKPLPPASVKPKLPEPDLAASSAMDDITSEVEEEGAVEKESSRPSRRKRQKVMDQHPAVATSPGSAVTTSILAAVEENADPQLPTIPSLRAPLLVPIELLSLGLSAWQRKRVASATDASHRDAMDGALSDLMWQLADQLTDGECLDLPEFYQARRSPSRPASAAHNARMEGERQCTIMQRMLEKLATQPASSHPAGGSAQNVAASSGSPPRVAAAEPIISDILFPDEKSVCAEHGEQPPLHATVMGPPIIAADGQDTLTLVPAANDSESNRASSSKTSPTDVKPSNSTPPQVSL
jgi:hypothetical protein